jgi:hypothetical protein
VNSAALIRPRESFAGTKLSSVVAMVPINTARLSHFCETLVSEAKPTTY